jgi:hypothetical protein
MIDDMKSVTDRPVMLTDRDMLRRALRFYRFCFGHSYIWPYRYGLQPYTVRQIRNNVYRLKHPEQELVEYSVLHQTGLWC